MKEKVEIAQKRFQATPIEHQELRLWLRLLTATNMVEKQIRERLRREYKTTLPRFDVMAALHREKDGLRMGELSRWLMVSNGNVTGIINRLCDEGLISRSQLPDDKRSTYVKLTKKGRREFETMSKSHENWLNTMFSDLSKSKMLQLQELIHSVKVSVANNTTEGAS